MVLTDPAGAAIAEGKPLALATPKKRPACCCRPLPTDARPVKQCGGTTLGWEGKRGGRQSGAFGGGGEEDHLLNLTSWQQQKKRRAEKYHI